MFVKPDSFIELLDYCPILCCEIFGHFVLFLYYRYTLIYTCLCSRCDKSNEFLVAVPRVFVCAGAPDALRGLSEAAGPEIQKENKQSEQTIPKQVVIAIIRIYGI